MSSIRSIDVVLMYRCIDEIGLGLGLIIGSVFSESRADADSSSCGVYAERSTSSRSKIELASCTFIHCQAFNI